MWVVESEAVEATLDDCHMFYFIVNGWKLSVGLRPGSNFVDVFQEVFNKCREKFGAGALYHMGSGRYEWK